MLRSLHVALCLLENFLLMDLCFNNPLHQFYCLVDKYACVIRYKQQLQSWECGRQPKVWQSVEATQKIGWK
jgi:hypothetical protein